MTLLCFHLSSPFSRPVRHAALYDLSIPADDFKDHRKKRFGIEAKNSQLRNSQGLARNKTQT